MIEPFKRAEVPGIGPEGPIIPVANPDCEWFFSEPSIARREYKGELLRLTPGKNGYEGWQYYVKQRAFVRDGEQPVQSGWHPIYPRANFGRQLLQALKAEWDTQHSSYKYVQEFEDAKLLFSEDYPLGEYWLLPEEQYLIPVDNAEQISNINELELHTLGSVEEVFAALQKAMAPLRDNVHGVIFSHGLHKARIRPYDFDWNDYEL